MQMTRALSVIVGLAALGCDAGAAKKAPAASVSAAATRKPAGFLKGQLHAHTGNSGDSETEPEIAARWYAARGYDFVIFTDHNVVTEIPAPSGMMLIRGVELTQNLMTCEPAPEPGDRCLLHVSGLRSPGSGAGSQVMRFCVSSTPRISIIPLGAGISVTTL